MWRASHSPSWTAALTAIETLPYLLFGLIAGAIADRYPRRLVMGATGMLAAGVITALALQGTHSPWALLIASAFASSFFVFSDAAGFGLLPELVSRDRIATAVSQSTAASTLISISGPALAGGLVALADVAYALLVDASLVAIGAVLLLTVPKRDASASGRTNRTGEPKTTSLTHEIGEGLKYLFSHRLIRTLTLLGIGNSVAGGMVLALLVPMITSSCAAYGCSDASKLVGVAYAVLGIGTFAATIMLPRASKRVQPGAITIAGLASVSVWIAVWACSSDSALGLIALVGYQCAASIVILNGITIRHLASPEHLQARINTTARMIAWGGQPLGATLAGLLVSGLNPTTILYLAAATVGATAIIAWRGSLLKAGKAFHEKMLDSRDDQR